MAGIFDHVLSVEAVCQYKTAAAAYQLGPTALRLPVEQILFVSSDGWDVVGATWFGYMTFWINRGGDPAERLVSGPQRPAGC